MRTVLLTRGAPGSGKTTFLQREGLLPYTVCPDTIRLLKQSPILDTNGDFTVNTRNDNEVWSEVWKIVENKMVNGEFICICGCFSKETDFSEIKHLAEAYRYRIVVVDFTDVDKSEVLYRNRHRGYARVPEETIEKQYARFANQKVPKYCKVIKPYEFVEYFTAKIFDFNNWKRVHIFGDLQGSFEPLREYLEAEGGIKSDEFYLFTGDLFDRGTENLKVAEFFKTNAQRENFLVLASNHGRWMNLWAFEKDEHIHSDEFKNRTARDFLLGNFTREDARRIIRKEGQYALFTYKNKNFFVNHGGIPKIDLEKLYRVPVKVLEKGVGGYGEGLDHNTKVWNEKMGADWYQVHGHRSKEGGPVQSGRVFRLEGEVEFNGHLHVLRLEENGDLNVKSVKNNTGKDRKPEVWDTITGSPEMTLVEAKTVEDFVVLMRSKKDIYEHRMGNISSFNFKKDVFHSASWNDVNIMARGLFIKTSDCVKPYVVGRSYAKSFNLNQMHETRMDVLKKTLQFPLRAYKKENGFLGILGLDNETDELIFCSKSRIDGEFSLMFKEIFLSLHGDKVDSVKAYIRANNRNLVFEVIDPIRDPHIIEYSKAHVVLLDAFAREMEDNKLDYHLLQVLGSSLGIPVKEELYVFESFATFESELYNLKKCGHEGYMFEDQIGFNFKLKGDYYSVWKKLRGVKDRIGAGQPVRLSALLTPLENEFYGWCKSQVEGLSVEERGRWGEQSIITLRNKFMDK